MEWNEEPNHPFMQSGNPKAACADVHLGLSVVARKHLKNQPDYTASAVNTRGITTVLDGFKDHLIHCLNKEWPMPERSLAPN